MIVWGHGRRLQTLGAVGRQACPKCGRVATIYLGVLRKQFTLYWIPVARWNGDYYLMCGICNASALIDKALGARLRAELESGSLRGDGRTIPPSSDGVRGPKAEGSPAPSKPLETFYDILGVAPDATEEEIRRAYRIRAQLVHPDHHAGASDEVVDEARRQMSLLSEAWEVLRDADRRAAYDATLKRQSAQGARPSSASRQTTTPGTSRSGPASHSSSAHLVDAGPRDDRAGRSNRKLIVLIGVVVGLVALWVGVAVAVRTGSQDGASASPTVSQIYQPDATTDYVPPTTEYVAPTVPPPWYPAGFSVTPDPNFAFKYLSGNDAHCDSYLSCWNIVAIPRLGCPNVLSVTLPVSDASGNVVGSASDSVLAPISPGQSALLKPAYTGTGSNLQASRPVFTCT